MLCEDVDMVRNSLHRHGIKPSDSDLLQILCNRCGKTDTCPSVRPQVGDRDQPARER